MPAKYRILIVEDDEDINTLLCEIVQSAGHDVQPAFSGTEGLLYVNQKEWDLILLDLMLPGKSGEEFLQMLREHFDIPVIVISAKEEADTKVKLLYDGADDYITKPFDNKEVVARIAAQLRRYSRTNPPSIQVYKDIVLDENSKRVTVSGKELSLTAKEYRLLHLFLNNKQKIFTKENIYESIWGADLLGDENTVHVHMSHLRTKLEKINPNETYIETIWGMGYRLMKEN